MESILQLDNKNRRKYIVIDLFKLKKAITTALVFIILATFLFISYSLDQLFFSEIATSSFILGCVVFIKLRGKSKTKY